MSINENSRDFLEAIAKGLQNDEFKMYLQFIVDNKTKNIVSAEALSRWETSDNVLIFPGKYIGLMEESGLITTLDYLMFEKACQKLNEWAGTDFENISISCNFTRITISESDFVDKIRDITARHPFARHKLIIEITEDFMEKNLEIAKSNLLAVKALGFTLALDDIGSGCASFRNLCEFPIDLVKLDRQTLLLTDTERGRKLFQGIVSLVHLMDLKMVCEGVETEEQNAFVGASGCDFVQGWYYSKALCAEQAEAFARAYQASDKS